MSVRSIGRLAEQRRPGSQAAARADGAPPDGGGPAAIGTLEAAVPTEIVVFYTTVIAACEAVLRGSADEMTAFRAWLFAATLAFTVLVSAGMVRRAVSSKMDTVKSAEWWTAVVAFTAWGLVVPGSFLYTWLDQDQLVVTVATVTAGAGLLLGTGLGPNLNRTVGGDRGRAQAETLSFFEPVDPDRPGPR